MPKIMVQIPLTKFLREITRDWGTPYLTKTYGGQVWLSDEAPGDCWKDEDNGNYIEFNESNFYIQLPKEIHQYIDLEPGDVKTIKQVLQEIKQKESGK